MKACFNIRTRLFKSPAIGEQTRHRDHLYRTPAFPKSTQIPSKGRSQKFQWLHMMRPTMVDAQRSVG